MAGYNRLNDFRCIGSNNRFHEFINKMKARISDGDPNAMVWQPTTQEKELLQWMEEYGKLYDEGHFDTSPDNFTFCSSLTNFYFYGTKEPIKECNLQDGDAILKIEGIDMKRLKHLVFLILLMFPLFVSAKNKSRIQRICTIIHN